MTLLDAYALIAFIIGGRAAPQVRALLRGGDAGLATVNLVETLDVSQRIHGLPVERVTEILDPLFEGPLTLLTLDRIVARRAAELRARHYHRMTRPISLADAVLLASAGRNDRLATADPDVLAVAQAAGMETVGLPTED